MRRDENRTDGGDCVPVTSLQWALMHTYSRTVHSRTSQGLPLGQRRPPPPPHFPREKLIDDFATLKKMASFVRATGVDVYRKRSKKKTKTAKVQLTVRSCSIFEDTYGLDSNMRLN